MKYKLLLSGLFLMLLGSTMASDFDVDSLFSEGNRAYGKSDFHKAIEVYELIADSGYVSSELFYNNGNAYYKLGNYPLAILYYERAKLLAPSNDDIEFNLSKAKTYIIDKIEIIPEFFIKIWIRKLILLFSSDEWAINSLVLFVLVVFGYLVYFFIQKLALKRASFFIASFLLVFSIISLYFSYNSKSYIENSKNAIIVEPTITVKGSPDNQSVDVFIIHEGAKVELLRKLGSWYEIKLSDGKQGWLESNDLIVI